MNTGEALLLIGVLQSFGIMFIFVIYAIVCIRDGRK